MADLALDAAQTDGARFGVRAENIVERIELHRVPHAGAGAVRFNQAHIPRGIVQLFKGFFYGNFLALGVGGGNAFAFPVGRSAHGADHGVHFVAVFNRVGKAF